MPAENDEVRLVVAETANRIDKLLGDAGVEPCHEVTLALGLVFALTCKLAGITREATLEAIADAYDNAELYREGKG